MIRMEHIAIVVSDMDEALATYRDMFGFEVTGTMDMPEAKVATISCGDISLELFQPVSDIGQFADFLNETGGGLHHIAFATDDIEGDFARMKAQGRKVQSEEPISIPSIGKIGFVAAGEEDVLIELMQRNK